MISSVFFLYDSAVLYQPIVRSRSRLVGQPGYPDINSKLPVSSSVNLAQYISAFLDVPEWYSIAAFRS